MVPGCLDSLPASLDFVPWMPGEGSWWPGFISWLHGLIVPWLPGLCSMVVWRRFLVAWIHFPLPWWRFMVAWIHFLDTWSWVHGCLKYPGCPDSLPDALDLFPWLSGEGSGCLHALPHSLVKVRGCLDFARWLPGEGFWMSGFTSWIPDVDSKVAC